MSEYYGTIEQEWQALSTELLSVLRDPLVWSRRIPTVDVGGYGIVEFKYYELKDVLPARRGMSAIGNAFDAALVTPQTKKIPVLWKDLQFTPRELASSRNAGIEAIDLRTRKEEAAKLIQDLEESISGGFTVPYTKNPIMQDLTDAGAGTDWGTQTNIQVDTAKNYAALLANKMYGPYYTIHYAPLAANTKILIANTGTVWEDYINRIATLGTDYTVNTTGGGGEAPSSSEGQQAMIQPVAGGQNTIEILRAQDWTTHDMSSAIGNFGIQMKIYGAMVDHLFRSVAGSIVDSIDT